MFQALTTALLLTLGAMSLAAYGSPSSVTEDTLAADPGGGGGGRDGGGSPGDNGDRLSL